MHSSHYNSVYDKGRLVYILGMICAIYATHYCLINLTTTGPLLLSFALATFGVCLSSYSVSFVKKRKQAQLTNLFIGFATLPSILTLAIIIWQITSVHLKFTSELLTFKILSNPLLYALPLILAPIIASPHLSKFKYKNNFLIALLILSFSSFVNCHVLLKNVLIQALCYTPTILVCFPLTRYLLQSTQLKLSFSKSKKNTLNISQKLGSADNLIGQPILSGIVHVALQAATIFWLNNFGFAWLPFITLMLQAGWLLDSLQNKFGSDMPRKAIQMMQIISMGTTLTVTAAYCYSFPFTAGIPILVTSLLSLIWHRRATLAAWLPPIRSLSCITCCKSRSSKTLGGNTTQADARLRQQSTLDKKNRSGNGLNGLPIK